MWKNSFPISLEYVKSSYFLILAFNSWIQNFPCKNVSRLEIFEIQINCYFEHFLRPRIRKIVPDYIKKVTALRNLDWEKKLWNPENWPCRLCKRFLPQVVFCNMPVNFLCSVFYYSYVTFLFYSWINFKLVYCFNPVDINPTYLQEFVLG